jgi:hypothetical protein
MGILNRKLEPIDLGDTITGQRCVYFRGCVFDDPKNPPVTVMSRQSPGLDFMLDLGVIAHVSRVVL